MVSRGEQRLSSSSLGSTSSTTMIIMGTCLAAVGLLMMLMIDPVKGFNTNALSSMIDSSIDACAADPPGWIKSPVSSPELQASIPKVLTSGHNTSFIWGTYQPNQYFAIKSRTSPTSLSSGILWHGAGGSAARARSECKQDDGLKKYGWTHHDGRQYGRQMIEDNQQDVKLITEFMRLDQGNKEASPSPPGHWASRIHVSTYGKKEEGQEDGPVTFLYLALDCDGAVNPSGCLAAAGSDGLSLQIERSKNQDGASALILGRTNGFGDFTLEVAISCLKKGSPLSITYFGASAVLLADLKTKIEEDQRKGARAEGDAKNDAGPLSVWSLSNTAEASSNVIVIRIAGAQPYQIDTMLRRQDPDEEEADVEEIPKLKKRIDAASAKGLQDFNTRFEQIFKLQGAKGYAINKKFSAQEIEAAKAAFSNMIGGMGYFYGRAIIKSNDGQVLKSFPTELFTAVPSRSFFPRGFLWDEGFHHLLLHKWDLGLTYDVILHWLSHLHVHPDCPTMGWIPRELALGVQSMRRIPQEFLPQDVQVANPPTFLLVIEKILSLPEQPGQCKEKDQEGVGKTTPAILRRQDFLLATQDRVEKWIHWLINSQRGEQILGSFRWRGRGNPQEKLMATTFASGLDDYPRASIPGPEEYHLDLLCWIIKGCQILVRLTKATGQEKASEHYQQVADELLVAMDSLHWNKTLGGYFDFGKHSEDGKIARAAVMRCAKRDDEATRRGGGDYVDLLVPEEILRQRQINPCPADHPEPLGLIHQDDPKEYYIPQTVALQHVPRVGYVNLFPFLLGLLPSDSPKLSAILAKLQDPKQLWSEYGIRSLSASDMFYAKENAPGDAPYWRGYIWININYLTLRALWRLQQTKGPYQSEAGKLYTSLRGNLLSTILGQYASTGYFWEQYHDQTGQGMRCHPFTGWTALVVNIMAEDY